MPTNLWRAKCSCQNNVFTKYHFFIPFFCKRGKQERKKAVRYQIRQKEKPKSWLLESLYEDWQARFSSTPLAYTLHTVVCFCVLFATGLLLAPFVVALILLYECLWVCIYFVLSYKVQKYIRGMVFYYKNSCSNLLFRLFFRSLTILIDNLF